VAAPNGIGLPVKSIGASQDWNCQANPRRLEADLTAKIEDMSLQDKVAIVTGAGNGIGRATAIRPAEEGAAVVVVDIEEQSAATVADRIVAAGGRALSVHGDGAEYSRHLPRPRPRTQGSAPIHPVYTTPSLQ
jgi:hypothetical protein